jgi:hypothetical protein
VRKVGVPFLVSKYLQDDLNDTLCLFSPNYEPRSLLGMEEFIRSVNPDDSRIKFGLIVFRPSSYRVELLEMLKNSNLAGVQDLLREYKHLPLGVTELRYPDEGLDRKLKGVLQNYLASLSTRFNFVLDTSTLPREVLLFLMDILKECLDSGKLNKFIILYSSSEKYPQQHYPAELGELITAKTYLPLKAMFESQNKVRAVQASLFIGRQGFDAKQFVESLPDSKLINVHVFMNRENVLHSLEVVRANAPILIDHSLNIHYYLTLPSGHEKLLRWARECPIEDNTTYLIAPFGPKPLVLSAWLAVRHIEQRIQHSHKENLFTDVILLGKHQYSTIYSLGFRSCAAYELDFQEFV